MMWLRGVHITSVVLWRGVLLAAPIDIVFVWILASRTDANTFRARKWWIAGTTAIFFFAIWALLVCELFWEPVYHYFFPAWSRWFLPLLYGAGFGGAGLISHSLALRIRGNCIAHFCILLGLWGMAGHIWALHRGLMETPPLLQGASPVAAVVFSGFEFVFYAGVILTAAALAEHARTRTMAPLR